MRPRPGVVRRGCARKGCAHLCAQRRMVVRKVVRGCAQNLAQSLVRPERHKAFALFTPPLFERHKVHNPCAKFISLNFFPLNTVGFT